MCGMNAFIGYKSFECDHFFDTNLKHRGPDQVCHWCSNFVQINYFRLSVTGGKSGDAPVTSLNTRWTCFMNGEIYNFKKLSSEYLGRHYESDCSLEFS